MSLGRSFLHECRPFFRVLEEQSRLAAPTYYGSHRLSRHWSPWAWNKWNSQMLVDIVDKGDSFVVEADVPGVKKENLEVRLGDRGRCLVIEGKVTSRLGNKDQQGKDNITSDKDSILSERTSMFMRKVWLPQAVDAAKVKAKLEDGVLSLHIPKASEDGSMRIEVV